MLTQWMHDNTNELHLHRDGLQINVKGTIALAGTLYQGFEGFNVLM